MVAFALFVILLVTPTSAAWFPFTHYRAGIRVTGSWATGTYYDYYELGMVFADMDATSRDKIPENVDFDGFQFTQSLYDLYAETDAARGFAHGMYSHARMDDLVDNYLNPKRYDVVPAYFIDTWHNVPESLWPLSSREQVYDYFVHKAIGGGDHNPSIDTSVWSAIRMQLIHQRLIRDRGNPVLSVSDLDAAKSRFANCFLCDPPGWIQWGQTLWWMVPISWHFSDEEISAMNDLFNYVVNWAYEGPQVPGPSSYDRYMRDFDYVENAAGSDPWLVGFDTSASTSGIGKRGLQTGDTIHVKFRVRHAGSTAVTLENLFVVGRLNGGGNYDFGYQGSFYFAPGDQRTVDVSRTLFTGGTWTFYIGYKYQGSWRAIWASSVSVSVQSSGGGGGGGGSPFIAAWNGTDYENDNNVLPLSEVYGRDSLDVVDYYRLHVPTTPREGTYSLKLLEFEEEHSFFDSVSLLAVDHDSNVTIGVHPQTGEIFTFEDPEPPESAVDNYGRDVLDGLLAWDGSTYEGWRGDYVELNFGRVWQEAARLVVVADVPLLKTRIYIHIWNGTDWQLADTMHHRMNFAEDIIDVSGFTPSNELRVRLTGASHFALEQVGLDTSKPEAISVQEAVLLEALHSSGQDVTDALSSVDASYAELRPGEEILLSFDAPPQPSESRSIIFFSSGHYVHKYQTFQGTDVSIAGKNVTFEAVIPEAPLGQYWDLEIVEVLWYFGDNETMTAWTAAHTYGELGEYRITVRIMYADGNVRWYERTILLIGSGS